VPPVVSSSAVHSVPSSTVPPVASSSAVHSVPSSTVPHVASSSAVHSVPSSTVPAAVTSKPPIPPTHRDSSTSSSGINISKASERHSSDTLPTLTSSQHKALPTSQISSTAQKISPARNIASNNQELDKLAKGISRALGEDDSPSKHVAAIMSSNDDDFSDDDDNVANGFDDVLDTYRQDFRKAQSSVSNTSTLTLVSSSTDQGIQPSSLDKGSSVSDRSLDTPHTPDSKNNDSA
ncbi:unnamed protein product, partial [Lymnaea stagnalis]